MNVIPLADLEAWHQYDPATSTNSLINDASGKGRFLSASSNQPVLTLNVLNGQPGWYFNGSSTNPLVNSSGISAKHIFIIASCDDTFFGGDRGLLTGQSAAFPLVGQSGTNKFYDVSATYGSYSFRRADVLFTVSTMAAPMSGTAYVIEMSSASGFALDGVQIGRDRGFSRIWKGYFFDNIIYSSVQDDNRRLRVHQYAAMRYNLWQKNAAGLDVFPFASQRTSAGSLDQESYQSIPYSGDPKVLVRGNDKHSFTLPFATRIQPEFDAAEAFHKTHRLPTHFIYRNYRYFPPRDSECWITSPLREQGSDTSFRFNYNFDAGEVS